MRLTMVDPTARFEEWWDWFAVGLFLLITVDLLTTMGAMVRVGPEAEANPLVRTLLIESPAVLAIVNLFVLIIAVICFKRILRIVQHTNEPYNRIFAIVIETWLGVIVAVGLFIFANNISVIIRGVSLL